MINNILVRKVQLSRKNTAESSNSEGECSRKLLRGSDIYVNTWIKRVRVEGIDRKTLFFFLYWQGGERAWAKNLKKQGSSDKYNLRGHGAA